MKSQLEWADALIPHLTDEELVKLRDSIDSAMSKRVKVEISKPVPAVKRRRYPERGNSKWNSRNRMPWPSGYSPRERSL